MSVALCECGVVHVLCCVSVNVVLDKCGAVSVLWCAHVVVCEGCGV